MSQRPATRLLIWNIVSVNLGWFACVLPAAWGQPWIGLPVVAVLVAIHLALSDARRREIGVLIVVGLFGYVADSIGVLLGIFDFPAASQLGGPSPLWMVALWFNFAVCLNVALYWLADRYLLAALFGLFGGPAAYVGGMQFGGMLAPAGLVPLIIFVAIKWALAMPLLLATSARIGTITGQPVPGRIPA